jgi:hypothetical protein
MSDGKERREGGGSDERKQRARRKREKEGGGKSELQTIEQCMGGWNHHTAPHK